jgi:hypothetical protein
VFENESKYSYLKLVSHYALMECGSWSIKVLLIMLRMSLMMLKMRAMGTRNVQYPLLFLTFFSPLSHLPFFSLPLNLSLSVRLFYLSNFLRFFNHANLQGFLESKSNMCRLEIPT